MLYYESPSLSTQPYFKVFLHFMVLPHIFFCCRHDAALIYTCEMFSDHKIIKRPLPPHPFLRTQNSLWRIEKGGEICEQGISFGIQITPLRARVATQ